MKKNILKALLLILISVFIVACDKYKAENSQNLKFYYGLMGAGKTKILVDEVFDKGRERFFIIGSGLKSTYKLGTISSRDYINDPSKEIMPDLLFDEKTDFYSEFKKAKKDKIIAIAIDDAHFLTPEQVDQLLKISKEYKIEVKCYGLMIGVSNEKFEGSAALFEKAVCIPIKSNSKCVVGLGDPKREHKAERLVRISPDCKVLRNVNQMPNGIEEKSTYKNVPICNKHGSMDTLKDLIDYKKIYTN